MRRYNNETVSKDILQGLNLNVSNSLGRYAVFFAPLRECTAPQSVRKHVADNCLPAYPSFVIDETRSALVPSPEGTGPQEEAHGQLWPFPAGLGLTSCPT